MQEMNTTSVMDKTDKAGEAYWSSFWHQHKLPAPVQLDKKSEGNYPYRKLDEFLKGIFQDVDTSGKKILEIGCGNSVYLSYFAQRFGFMPEGLDYSEYGCQQTRNILERDGVKGLIHHGDLFHPPHGLLGKFDVVCSFGVVEHFNDTTDVLKSISGFLKPGGIIITTIPNLTGPTGWLQRLMNKPVYDIHKVMGLKKIRDAHAGAGLEIISSRHLIPLSFGVTLEEKDEKRISHLKLKKTVLKFFQTVGRLVCLADDRLVRIPETELLCAGMVVAARKPLNT